MGTTARPRLIFNKATKQLRCLKVVVQVLGNVDLTSNHVGLRYSVE